MVGDGLIKVAVSEAALNASVLNRGTIEADGGNVLLTARSANALLDTVINTDGIIRANTISNRNGTIILDGGDRGIVSVAGAIEAKGNDAGTTGGTIKALGQYVGVGLGGAAATVTASGDAGGGNIFIGGNFHGAGPEQNASQTIIGKSAIINADAVTSGNGGQVAVWSDNATQFYGNISARGGAQSGDGGFVEVSGKHYLNYAGLTDLRAPHGRAGTLLLDPNDILITANNDPTTTDPSINVHAGRCSGPFVGPNFVDAATAAGTANLAQGTLNGQLGFSNVTVNADNISDQAGRQHQLKWEIAFADSDAVNDAARHVRRRRDDEHEFRHHAGSFQRDEPDGRGNAKREWRGQRQHHQSSQRHLDN
jgi:large exoprotein involved in heme utilization and adhesion